MKAFTFSYKDGKVSFSSKDDFEPSDWHKTMSIMGSYIRFRISRNKKKKINHLLSDDDLNRLHSELKTQFPRESFRVDHENAKILVLCHEDKVWKDLFKISHSDCKSCQEKAILAKARRILAHG